MSQRSVQSTSTCKKMAGTAPKMNTTASFASAEVLKCPQTTENSSRAKVSSLLAQSLAIALVKVRRDCGVETAKHILEILRDECFDIDRFKNSVSSMEECDKIISEIAGCTIE